jgi:hypothetical protein
LVAVGCSRGRIRLRPYINVDTGGEQQPRALDVTFASGKVERGESAFRVCQEVGLRLDKDSNDIWMVFSCGPHQCRLVLR